MEPMRRRNAKETLLRTQASGFRSVVRLDFPAVGRRD